MDFLTRVKIKSKEFEGGLGPIVPYNAQRMFLKEVCDGLDDDCHFFVTLKARQLGMTTVMLALDLFWLSMHPGLDGALILDSAENLTIARDTISEMLSNLPKAYQLSVVKNNRDFLSLSNGSRLQYLAAGKRSSNKTFGISRAYSFVHCSEVGAWGDPDAVKHLTTTLAQKNPSRLYIFESTAFGFNGFKDIYDESCADGKFQRSMFIGWWAKEIYSHEKGSREYEQFWGDHPRFTLEEKEKIRTVKALYGVEITDEQVSWYRSFEQKYSEEMMQEKYPWYAEEAFVATGLGFFANKRVTEDMKVASGLQYTGYDCQLGNTFMDLNIKFASSKEDVDLRVWTPPRRGAVYCMGVDPAFGSSETADRTVISLWRAYADKLIQVAEYATPEPTSHQAAWIMAYLAAAYGDVRINIELNGPGEAVMREIKYLKEQMRVGRIAEVAGQLKVGQALDSIRWFLERKVDTMGGGFAYNFRTTLNKKITMFNQLRDNYNYHTLVPRSVPLLEEMLRLRQDGDNVSPQAGGAAKDDRVFAAALACKTWCENVRAGQMARADTFDLVTKKETAEDEAAPMSVENAMGAAIVRNYFWSRMEDARAEALKKFRRGI